jgi:hypothetical protein
MVQVQVFVPASVLAHVAFGEQPPLLMEHPLIGAQEPPSPAKP